MKQRSDFNKKKKGQKKKIQKEKLVFYCSKRLPPVDVKAIALLQYLRQCPWLIVS